MTEHLPHIVYPQSGLPVGVLASVPVALFPNYVEAHRFWLAVNEPIHSPYVLRPVQPREIYPAVPVIDPNE